ncbi:MAG: hypothetical protein P8Y70_00070 [Candidatus Lokiarchaeota archaeon]
MSLIVGQNSWCTISEADEYLTTRMNASNWFSLNDEPANPGEDSKETFLISAFNWLLNSSGVSLSITLTDYNVKKAQIEAGLFLLHYGKELEDRRSAIFTGVKSFRFSNRSETLDIYNLRLPFHIINLLSDYNTVNTTVLLKGEYDE